MRTDAPTVTAAAGPMIAAGTVVIVGVSATAPACA